MTTKRIFLGFTAIIVLIIGWTIINIMAFGNTSAEYTERFNGTCQKIPGVIGGEDIDIDKNGIAWISAYDRRSKTARGKFYTLDMKAANPRLIDRTPSQPPNFRPHGIDLFTDNDGTRYLFATNHPTNGTQNILRYRFDKGQLNFSGLFQAPAIASPNDVVAVGKNQFYWTNDLGTKRGTLSQLFELIFRMPWGSLGFFNGEKARIVFDDLIFGNGITTSPDGKTLYVAETGGNRLNFFDRNPQTNALTLRKRLDVPHGIDNLSLDGAGNIWAAYHSKPFMFGPHAEDPSKLSPSQVFKISLTDFKATEIYYNHGSELNAAATAAVYGKKILLGPVFDDHLLLCTQR